MDVKIKYCSIGKDSPTKFSTAELCLRSSHVPKIFHCVHSLAQVTNWLHTKHLVLSNFNLLSTIGQVGQAISGIHLPDRPGAVFLIRILLHPASSHKERVTIRLVSNLQSGRRHLPILCLVPA